MPEGPDWPHYVRTHLPQLDVPREREDRMLAELAEHLEDVYRDALDGGASPDEARAQAEQRFGDADLRRRGRRNQAPCRPLRVDVSSAAA